MMNRNIRRISKLFEISSFGYWLRYRFIWFEEKI